MLSTIRSATLIWLLDVVSAEAQGATSKYARLPPLETGKLESLYREDWQNKNLSDEQHGIFVEVVPHDKPRPAISIWCEVLAACVSACFSKNTADGTERWIGNTSISPTCDVKVRIRQDTDTVRYLIKTADAPLFPRYIALREIYEVPFSQEERLALIEGSSRDPKAEMRYMAILKTWDFQPRAKVVPICTRALTDPSLDVATSACSLLIDEFDVRDPKTGKRLEDGGFFSGPPISFYVMEHDIVLRIAEYVHAADPTLVTDKDLAIIHARRNPPEEWWKWTYGKDYQEAQKRYLDGQKYGPEMLQTFPLDALDAAATLADLKAQFPGVRLTTTEDKVIVLARRNQLAKIKARIDWLKGKADDQ